MLLHSMIPHPLSYREEGLGLGVKALFNVNVFSPPASALQRRETMSFLNKRKSGSRSSLSTAITMLRDSPSSSSSLPLQALSKDETLRLTRRRKKNRASYSVKDVNMDEEQPTQQLDYLATR